jgi:hypothetical protein
MVVDKEGLYLEEEGEKNRFSHGTLKDPTHIE